jgi:hypothetical protein
MQTVISFLPVVGMKSYERNKQTNKYKKLRRRYSVAAQFTAIRHLSLHSLLPETQHYMTYEGSTTHPGCWETTVWIILNRPIYITKQEVRSHTTRCSANWSITVIITYGLLLDPVWFGHTVNERTTAHSSSRIGKSEFHTAPTNIVPHFDWLLFGFKPLRSRCTYAL